MLELDLLPLHLLLELERLPLQPLSELPALLRARRLRLRKRRWLTAFRLRGVSYASAAGGIQSRGRTEVGLRA